MKKQLLCSALIMLCLNSKAQLFSQNFSSSTTVSDYVSATPSVGQFTAIGNPAENSTSIFSEALRFSKTGSKTGWFSRNAEFSGPPTLMQISFDFSVSGNQNAAVENTQATFYVGTALGDGATDPANTKVHSKFAFSFDNSEGSFFIRKLVGAANGNSYSGKQPITFIINNSGSTKTYMSPAGIAESIADDTWDLFVGSTKEFNDIAATSGDVALSSFRFSYPSSSENAKLDFDNLIINELATLPISLSSFAAKKIDEGILLAWSTTSEKSNAYFVIERSADAKKFYEIGKIIGAGNSSAMLSYNFTDSNPYAGTNYYRLVQYDYDGKASILPVTAVDSKRSASQINVYAEHDRLKVFVSSPNKTRGTLQVFDCGGHKLACKEVDLNKGYNEVYIPLNTTHDVKFLRYFSESESIVRKFIK